MKRMYPELALERILIALERDLVDATDEEILGAARELGMNPSMKGSAAFFGVTRPVRVRSWSEQIAQRQSSPRARRRTKRDGRLTKATREQILSWLAALTPQQAKALHARFGIDEVERTADEEEIILRALARDFAVLQKKV